MRYDEDHLVQQTTADYLARLKWQSLLGYNTEVFNDNGPLGQRSAGKINLGRTNENEVVLRRYLQEGLVSLNPGLPAQAYANAVRQLTEISAAQSPLQTNRDLNELIRSGVKVTYPLPHGGMGTRTLRVIDFDNPDNNSFLCVRELWIKGSLYRRRADIVGFVNGLPLLFMEVKNLHKSLLRAHDENLSDYRDTIPHLFYHNAITILGNGHKAVIGAYSTPYKFFREWKRLEEDDKGVVDMETLLKGVCDRRNFLDLVENYILFDDSTGDTIKIVAQNQQFLGVNRAVEAVKHRQQLNGRLGVFWHTQGAGKSYSMVFFARKIHRKLGGNFTFLVLTDREDLDNQIYRTFVGTGAVKENDDVRAANGGDLKSKLTDQHAAYVFSLIQKFNKPVAKGDPYSDRSDIIVMTDEAHRTQYGTLALNMRLALPNVSYIGFTGTPLMKGDEITKQVFGGYISKYGFQRAVEDGATLPLYYDARGEKLDLAHSELNERIAEKLEEFEAELSDRDVATRLEHELKREYHIITADDRLDAIAKDFVEHYSTRWESGKAMLVCIDKVTCARMYGYIFQHWHAKTKELEKALKSAKDEQEAVNLQRLINWMKETLAAVVVSEEQGEVAKFREWNIDITPHRKLLKEGFTLPDGSRLDMETAFKRDAHPFRIAIVCAMWLTGFDVKSLATLYLDKPLKAHTLMQAIARANRVKDGKENGLIVDYCGILKNLRKALATFGGHTGDETPPPEIDPLKPETDLLAELDEAIGLVRGFLTERGINLDDLYERDGFDRNAALVAAKEAINADDEGRKRFEIMARAVFAKFKACLTLEDVLSRRTAHAAINYVYKSLEEDRDQADISKIMQELHKVVADAVQPRALSRDEPTKLYNIAAIDFERLRQEFERSPNRNTQARALRDAIEARLARMIAKNPLRINFQQHYEELVAEYNAEKDRVTIEETFERLLKLVAELDEEEKRAAEENLPEDALPIFDLLRKDTLTPADIKKIKAVAVDLYARLQKIEQDIANWRATEGNRDRVHQMIYDTLYTDETGLPGSYDAEEINVATDRVYQFVYSQLHKTTALHIGE